MAYFAPYIDASGLHLPTYDDINAYEQEQFQSVYGASVNFGIDAADAQWIGNFSLMINDAFNTAQLAVNGRSPATAIGADLDSVVKINGITRKSATPSQAVLYVTGNPGTELDNAVAQDQNGFLWNLPSIVILSTGSANVIAVCQANGQVAAPAGSINIRSTPIAGWLSVTNPSDAIVGTNVESDSALRARQALSVSLSAKTLVDSTLAAIAAVSGVTRYNPGTPTPSGPGTSVENPTGAIDSWGNPPHSISMVVEGGADLDVATAIYNNKTPGCLTNGSTTVAVTDTINNNTMDISFSRPTYEAIYVGLNIHQLTGYTSAVQSSIIAAVVAYLNSLQIGESLTISGLTYAAMSVMPNVSLPLFSVRGVFAKIGSAPGPGDNTDIPINFNQVAQGSTGNVTVTIV